MKKRTNKLLGRGLPALLAVCALALGPLPSAAAQDLPQSGEAPSVEVAEPESIDRPEDVDDSAAVAEQGEPAEAQDFDAAVPAAADDTDEPSEPGQGGKDELNVKVEMKTPGASAFDETDAPGFATGNLGNGQDGSTIVRVNDKVTYIVDVVANGRPLDDSVLTVTFPKGVWMDHVPGFCNEGQKGTLVPERPLDAVEWPITDDSVNETLEQQVLTCYMGSFVNTTRQVELTAHVGNLVPNGHIYEAPRATFEGVRDGAEERIEAEREANASIQASSKLMWNLSKNATSDTEDTKGFHRYEAVKCPSSGAGIGGLELCDEVVFPVLISAPRGGLGVMPIVGDATWTEDYSPRAIYKDLTEEQYQAIEADMAKYAPTLEVRNKILTRDYQPGYKMGKAESSVRDSGTATYSIKDSKYTPTTEPGVVTLSGTDWSLLTVPERYENDKTAIPKIDGEVPGYAVSISVALYVPNQAARDFGKEDPAGTWTIKWDNRFTDFKAKGFGDAEQDGNYSLGGEPYDCGKVEQCESLGDWLHQSGSTVVRSQGSFSKQWIGVPGEAVTPQPEFWVGHTVAGPPGGATHSSGDITAAPRQNVFSYHLHDYSGDFRRVSDATCDIWDANQVHLRAAEFEKPKETNAATGGAWGASYQASSGKEAVYAFLFSEGKNTQWKVQYSATPNIPGDATSNYCGDSAGPWYDNPEDVPGVEVVDLSDGSTLYKGIARSRMLYVTERTGGGNINARTVFSMQLAAGLQKGEKVGNWASKTSLMFDDEAATSLEELEARIADDEIWQSNDSHLAGDAGSPNSPNGYWDWLTVYPATVQITKTAALQKPGQTVADSDYGEAAGPGVFKDKFFWKLQPALVSIASGDEMKSDVTVEDCMPAEFTYESAAPEPTMVINMHASGAKLPADAELACESGTYMRWVLPDVPWNQAMDPIVVESKVALTAKTGIYTNTAIASSPDAANALSGRTDSATGQISTIKELNIDKTLLTPQVQVNRPGSQNLEDMAWKNVMQNTRDEPIENPRMIDVLPVDGNVYFKEASNDGIDAVIYYSKGAGISPHPDDPSNGPDGDTIWCTAPPKPQVVSGNGTAADCPQDLKEVTGVQWAGKGPLGNNEALAGTVTMTAVGNKAGDIYPSEVGGAGDGVQYHVGPSMEEVITLSSSIGDYTWWDHAQQGFQDTDGNEPAEGVRILVQGTDDLGNPVVVYASSAEDGSYLVDGLRSGRYTVVFTLPKEADSFTVQMAGVDKTNWSAPNVDTGVVDLFSLGINEHNMDIDAGLIRADEPTVEPPPVEPPPVEPPPPTVPLTPTPPPVQPTLPETGGIGLMWLAVGILLVVGGTGLITVRRKVVGA